MGIRAAKYRRVSSLTSKDGASLETQDEDLDKRILEKGYQSLVEHNYEEVFTGTVWRERGVLQQMLQAASRHEFDVLLIHHTDRLAREDHLTIIIEQLAYYGVRVESYLQEIENTPTGKLMLAILAFTARQHRDRIVESTQRGKYKRAREKALHGGTPLYGYAYENPERGVKHFGARNRYIYNDVIIHKDAEGVEWSERKVVEEIFRLAKEGVTIWAICRILTKKGIPPRKGGKVWSHSTVGDILREEAYTGKYVSYARKAETTYTLDKAHKRYINRPPDERVVIEIPAIIDVDTFKLVQASLIRNQQFAAHNNSHPEDSLLRAGIIRCGYCGKPMTVVRHPLYKTVNYFCQAAKIGRSECKTVQISAKIIDNAVWRRTCEIIRDPKKLQEAIEALKNPDPALFSRQHVEQRLQEIETELTNLVEMGKNARSKTVLEQISVSISLLESEQETLLHEEEKLSLLHETWEEVQNEIFRFTTWCVSYRDKLESATYQEKRIAIEMLGITCRVFKYGELNEQGKPKRYFIEITPPQILKIVSALSSWSGTR